MAHFEPDIVQLYGEGVFPRVSLDLPRYIDDSGYYESLLKEARKILMPGGSDQTLAPVPPPTLQEARGTGTMGTGTMGTGTMGTGTMGTGTAPVTTNSSRHVSGVHLVRQHGLFVRLFVH